MESYIQCILPLQRDSDGPSRPLKGELQPRDQSYIVLVFWSIPVVVFFGEGSSLRL